MKQFGGLVFAIGSAVGLCFVGSATASLMMKPQKGSMSLRQVDVTDVWTTTPVKVDVHRQSFERVASIAPVDPPAAPRIAIVVPPTAEPVGAEAETLSAEHLAWCADRYRSYDPATNSYRSYGGAIRTCISPDGPAVGKGDMAAGLPADHLSWCAERYRSYRAEDNTYRSYSGERRDCVSPHLDQTMDVASRQ